MRVWQFLILLAALGLVFVLGVLTFNFMIMPRLVHRHHEVRVPMLAGQDFADALETADALGLILETVHTDAHPTISVGGILDQAPLSGTMIRQGRRIAVVVSRGPAAGPVPDVLNLSQRQAEATLQRESYRLGNVYRLRDPSVVITDVAWQSPAAGTPLRKGERVDLVLGVPAAAVALLMPDLRGRSLFAVRASVEGAGCLVSQVKYRRENRLAPNTILEQRPAPGARILKGAPIELVASTR